MPLKKMIDPHSLLKQYKDASNLDVRFHLHQLSSVNNYGWHSWVFDHIDLPTGSRILELDCDPGFLWLDNFNRIPAGWEIVLSDSSAGMLKETTRNLETQSQLQYKLNDARSISLASGHFDAFIAYDRLYHVHDLPAALSEIRRA
jgi:ubiquinone/menaquinone biosynthesis C-methylase UbiE